MKLMESSNFQQQSFESYYYMSEDYHYRHLLTTGFCKLIKKSFNLKKLFLLTVPIEEAHVGNMKQL